MKSNFRPQAVAVFLLALGLLAGATPWFAHAATPAPQTVPALHMPWREAGLSERQAAAHLLSRFTFGARPGDVDQVAAMGLDRWFQKQLQGDQPDPQVAERLRRYDALALSSQEIFRRYPPPVLVLAEMRREGLLPAKAKAGKAVAPAAPVQSEDEVVGDTGLDKKQLRAKAVAYGKEKGYRPERELIGQAMAQKLVRAVYSENQLSEVMTDFWFNHFNVSLTSNKVRPYILTYERDAIRPNVLGPFRDLLEATARHPAMLLYLDNAQSAAPANAETTMGREIARRGGIGGIGGNGDGALGRRRGGLAGGGRFGGQGAAGAPGAAAGLGKLKGAGKGKERGLNENYAREIMELHTLGVDAGYTQQDVIEVARAFTGWGLLPAAGPARQAAEKRLERVQRSGGLGFAEQGDFLFRADIHDAGSKSVLGKTLPAGRGIEDGEEVLDILAAHPATARHLATQIAARFVADQPPAALVDRLAGVYQKSRGDIRAVLAALVQSPEFWRPEARGAKIKSPFELASSSLRALGADVKDPRETLQWIAKIGQPLYAYRAPTGYPDRGESWVNTGSLLNRMNFGLQLAAGRVKGVTIDLAALNNGHEPESREAALTTYAHLLMPERDLSAAIAVLQPMVTAPDLARRVDEAAPDEEKAAPAGGAEMAGATLSGMAAKAGETDMADETDDLLGKRPNRRDRRAVHETLGEPTPVEQVVGVILGSPEFQRR